jgi:hypothetical protein
MPPGVDPLAGAAQAHDCMIVTDTERDFVGLPFINPLRNGSV